MLIKNNNEPLKPSCTSGLYLQQRKRSYSHFSPQRRQKLKALYNSYLDNGCWWVGGLWCGGMLAAVILNAINVIATLLQVTGR